MKRATESYISSSELMVRTDRNTIRSFICMSSMCVVVAVSTHFLANQLAIGSDAEFLRNWVVYPSFTLGVLLGLFAAYLCVRFDKIEAFLTANDEGVYINKIVERRVPWSEIQEVHIRSFARSGELIFLKIMNAREFISEETLKRQKRLVKAFPYPKDLRNTFESCDIVLQVPDCSISRRQVYEFLDARVTSAVS